MSRGDGKKLTILNMTVFPDTSSFPLHSPPLPPPPPSLGLRTSFHLAYPLSWAHTASQVIVLRKIRELHSLAQNPSRTLHWQCCKVSIPSSGILVFQDSTLTFCSHLSYTCCLGHIRIWTLVTWKPPGNTTHLWLVRMKKHKTMLL